MGVTRIETLTLLETLRAAEGVKEVGPPPVAAEAVGDALARPRRRSMTFASRCSR